MEALCLAESRSKSVFVVWDQGRADTNCFIANVQIVSTVSDSVLYMF